jgi:hypothetical protein
MASTLFPCWRGDFTVGDNFKPFPEAFQQLEEAWGPNTVDLFAHPANAQVHTFCGPAKPRKKIWSCYKYAGKSFDLDWSKCHCYAFPPYELIGAVLDKVQSDKCELTLVTPLNTKAPWFRRCLELTVTAPIIFDYTHTCMLGFGTGYRDVVSAPWGNYVAWRVAAAPPPMSEKRGLRYIADELERLESMALEALDKAKIPPVPTLALRRRGRTRGQARPAGDDPNAGVSSVAIDLVSSHEQQKYWALLKHLEGHVGSTAMVSKLKADGHSWTGMQDLCQSVIKECYACQVHKLENPKYHELRAVTASLPMDHLAIDCHTMNVPSQGYCVLLSVVDMCT